MPSSMLSIFVIKESSRVSSIVLRNHSFYLLNGLAVSLSEVYISYKSTPVSYAHEMFVTLSLYFGKIIKPDLGSH
jgi:hypothetical protein